MLLSMTHKFIFIANLKTASTSIHKSINQHAEINLSRSEWGKHIGIQEIEKRFSWLFEQLPVSNFAIFGVIRDPEDWLFSLYRSMTHPKFANHPAFTGHMSFSQFLGDWCQRFPDMSRPQVSRFKRADGQLAATRVIEYAHLQTGINSVLEAMSLPTVILPKLNKSPDLELAAEISSSDRNHIMQKYSPDYELLAEIRKRPGLET